MDQHEHHARVHTGDAVSNRPEQDFSYLAPYDFMFAMGNHDCILLYGTEHWVETGYDWTKQPTQDQLYAIFFEPTLRKNPVVIESNKTYWHRDYEEFGILIIGINSCLRDDELFQEHLWFENVLADSKDKNLKVFVACHYPPYDVKATRCCFTDEMCMPSLYSGSMLTSMAFYPKRLITRAKSRKPFLAGIILALALRVAMPTFALATAADHSAFDLSTAMAS